MNQLADSLSPYLLQHKDNPVDWFPWCDEAFEQARQTDRPVFLSIGYAACHWCHVMEHESFENESIADFLNSHFVSIKVDREERPDIDQIYMNAVQVMTGHGGWPMSVFLDHDRKPFYAGTYWPAVSRGGMPGFPQVLEAIGDAWTHRRTQVIEQADQITETLHQLANSPQVSNESPVPSAAAVDQALNQLMSAIDRREGGFGSAPKFPNATNLLLILQRAARFESATSSSQEAQWCEALNLTLDKMACGGIRDHLGGGFSRYTVDAKWLVPHFEKMLYDNGLLAMVFLKAFQLTGQSRHAQVATETLDYLIREMTDSQGGFHCSEDADSEGVEGKYYVWKPEEVRKVLGSQRAASFCQTYDITEHGNFEGKNILHLDAPLKEDPFCDDREKLRRSRQQRIHPGRDDKVIVAWNALAIEALAISAQVLGRRDHEDAAVQSADFVFDQMSRSDGRLLHAYRDGQAHLDAYLDDYSYLANACVALFECTGAVKWIEHAMELCEILLKHFCDRQHGGFFYTADDSEKLITRNKDWQDGSLVSGNAAAARAMWRLHWLDDRPDWHQHVLRTLVAGTGVIQDQSMAAGALVTVLDQVHQESQMSQWVFAVPDTVALHPIQKAISDAPRSDVIVSWVIESPEDSCQTIPLNAGKQLIGGKSTWYRCQNQVCDEPIVGMEAISEGIAGL